MAGKSNRSNHRCKGEQGSRRSVGRFGGLWGLLLAGSAHAFTFDTGNPDVSVRWDNTIRYNLGVRAEGRDPRIANNSASDEGDFKFNSGDIVANRLDLLSEFEADWKQIAGVRVSATAWTDAAYHDTRARQNSALAAAGAISSYKDGEYSSLTKRYYRGPSAELLDAFGYLNTDIADMPLGLRVGRHALYWGTALFSNGGIAFNQNPIDARKAVANPGIEAREVQLPLNQISASLQMTPQVSVSAQYFLDWSSIRSPEGGTFLAGSDATLEGPNRLGGEGPLRNLPLLSPLGPSHNTGNWGINTKFTVPELNATTFGLYYRQFDEKNQPWLFLQMNGAMPAGYRPVFARNTRLVGVSMDTTVAGTGVGAELSYRMDGSLLSRAFAPVTEGARGNSWHALINMVYSLQKNPLWDAGTLLAELTYDRLDKVTKNASLFNEAGSSNCPLGKFSGCATRDGLGLTVRFAPQWLQVMPGVDLSVPLFVSAGLKGNSPTSLGVNQGAISYSIGAELDIRKQYTVGLTFADSFAKIIPDGRVNALGPTYTGNGSGWLTTDRRRVVLTFKTAF